MNTFNKQTVESFWSLGKDSRVKLLMVPYSSGSMNYWADVEYKELPYGVQQRLELAIEILEKKRLGK